MRIFLMVATAAFLVGCGKPKVGESCKTAGDASLCESTAMCTNNASGTATCRTICTDNAQCATTEQCNGISGSNIRSCQPK